MAEQKKDEKKAVGGQVRYRIKHGWYDGARLHPAGSTITVGADVKPSKTWTKLDDAPQAPSAATAPGKHEGGRPSDKSPV